MNVPPDAPPRPPDDPSVGTRPHRLVREPDDRRIAGVCAGLADRFGVDVSLVRLAAVALAVFTPFGLIAYLVAWVVVPRRRPDEARVVAPPADLHQLHRVPLWLLVVGTVAIAFTAADGLWWWRPSGPLLAIALVGFGVWLLAQGQDTDGGTPGPVAPDTPGPAPREAPVDPEPPNGDTLGGRSTTLHVGFAPTLDASEGAGPPGELPPPASPRWPGAETDDPAARVGPDHPPTPVEPGSSTESLARSHLALAVVALLLIGAGLAWLLYVLDVATLSVHDGLAAGLVVVGLGLVVAAWRGRAWSLAVIGLLFGSVLVLGEVIDVPFDAGTGKRRVVVDTRSELAGTHELFAGELTLDLRHALQRAEHAGGGGGDGDAAGHPARRRQRRRRRPRQGGQHRRQGDAEPRGGRCGSPRDVRHPVPRGRAGPGARPAGRDRRAGGQP